MTDAPLAYAVHDGHGTIPRWKRQLIAAWLTANDISPDDVSATHPLTVITVPFRPAGTVDDAGPLLIQVIVLHQYYVRPDGAKEEDLITRRPVAFQRTVPLKVAWPPDPAPEPAVDSEGRTDSQPAEESSTPTPEEEVSQP
ncbi:hypothetical protein [Streptomyces scabiei]|uniref:hypothetical protein n=1 Tax=Streptomyces scabiei TaxID=1930 RepID=UPI00068FB479|nr:hypothetical protein [Streptomyces scabiei]